MWNQVNAVLEEAQTILAELQSYTGAGQEIREVGEAPATPLPAHPPTRRALGQPWRSPPARPSKTPGTCGCRSAPGAPCAPWSPS